MEFLSTPSARRATIQTGIQYNAQLISIHALREEGDAETRTLPRLFRISIHALREEGDTSRPDTAAGRWKFLSTPSARRATGDLFVDHHQITISIHALREEGDPFVTGRSTVLMLFLSTPSARRAT